MQFAESSQDDASTGDAEVRVIDLGVHAAAIATATTISITGNGVFLFNETCEDNDANFPRNFAQPLDTVSWRRHRLRGGKQLNEAQPARECTA